MPLARSTTSGPSARRDGLLAFAGLGAGLAVLGTATQAPAAVLAVATAAGVAVLGAVVRSTVRRTAEPYGPADRVTVARSVLVALCAAMLLVGLAPVLVDGVQGPAEDWCWAVVAVALPAWLLDGIDGRVARRTGTATRAGARFDQEVDAVLLLVLALAVAARLGLPGAWWVLLIGALRYLFLLGLRARPPWRRPLPFSSYRRVVAGIQGGVLLGALVPLIPLPLAAAATAVALALLLVSFGRDVLWLQRTARGLS
jgi:phosphatidylglycerophosphate synthase